MPTLVEVSRMDHGATKSDKEQLTAPYNVTDLDVLNYTNRIKINLSRHFTLASGARYGASLTQTTLSALAGAASTAGWSVATASGLGAGSSFISGIGQVFDAKGDAQAYETAFVEIQRAESLFYFYQVGGKFITPKDDTPPAKAKTGSPKAATVKPAYSTSAPNGHIPNGNGLSKDGEMLYYRVICILQVLDDALAKKIPDLQALKDAKGDTSPTSTPSPTNAGSATKQ
jgi:hypothetical protein